MQLGAAGCMCAAGLGAAGCMCAAGCDCAAECRLQVMADLVGPKFRIGNVFWTGVELQDYYSVTMSIASR